MRRYWYSLLLLAPFAAVAHAEDEVIASTEPMRPVAMAPRTPSAPPITTVNLGRLRVMPATLEAPMVKGTVVRAARPDDDSAPLSRADYRSSFATGVTRAVALEKPGQFAVERVGLFSREPKADPMPMPMSKEVLTNLPKSTNLDAPPVIEGMLDDQESGLPPFRMYGSVEYLAWWTRPGKIPPLVTTTTNPNPTPQMQGQPPTDFGVIGAPTTQILVGGELDHGLQHGVRFRAGYWLENCNMAIEGSYFRLFSRSDDAFFASDGTSVILRPFFNGNQGFEDGEVVAGPGVGPGTISINSPLSLQGADLNLRCPLLCSTNCWGNFKLDAFAGARWLRMHEAVDILEQGTIQPSGQFFRIQDRFDTYNNFYGAQIGLIGEYRRGKWSVEGRASVAAGLNNQVVRVRGEALFVNPDGSSQLLPGGLLALPSNIGRFDRNAFSVVPEIGMTVGYNVTDSVRVFAGYNFLWWSNVVRAGDQIDRVLDVTQIPNFGIIPRGDGTFIARNGQIIRPLSPARPAVPFKESSFWATGATLGVEVKY